ncbi:AAA family ATPase [Candidatus Jettenia sp. AMX1]|uniref:AAA family ATPase n=1 Tax=Candidatus Jettenia sp. AMX1 TaxID=2293637 RepID=UPI002556CCE7|nr:AAA family ATPase [Candidatus Jettenia sp. AMX1]MDL1939906.1 AAA family ATPase [Candidatus Jettenia sp. AMX1]
MSRLAVLAEYGYRKDPFRGMHLETADITRVKRIIGMAVESRAMVSIIAERGNGKSRAVDSTLRDMDVKVISLFTSDKEKVLVGDIERALIADLSQEEIKRTREIRARQLRRIMGEASRRQEIVLILEEAHRLHGQTLRSLKTLREMEWMGQSPLFTVIMLGQYDPMRKPGVDEVRLRTDTVYMKGLTQNEVKDYTRATLSRLRTARNFLELQEMLIALMERALACGHKKVTAFEVFDLYGGGLKELIKLTDISLSEIADETGISKATLSLVANDRMDKLTDDTASKTREAIAEVIRKKMEGKAGALRQVAGA